MNSRPGKGGAPCSITHALKSSHSAVHPLVLVAELMPAGPVRRWIAGKRGRDVRTLDLERVARHDPQEGRARGHQRWETDHVVLDDHVGAGPVNDRGQPVLAIPRAGDQLLPDGPDPGFGLLDRRLAEFGRGVADEILPELPGVLVRSLRAGRVAR